MSRLLTARAVADLLDVNPETVLRWARRGQLPAIRLPGGETIVAHVPHDELGDASEGDEVWIDLRSPKAFGIEAGTTAPGAPAAVKPANGTTPVSDEGPVVRSGS